MRDKSTILFLLVCFIFAPFLGAQDRMKYEVKVEALLIPLFAHDTKGNPIYDLKKEDVTLYINKKPVEINYFNSFKYHYDEKVTKIEPVNNNTNAKSQPVTEAPERVVFVLIDAVFNSPLGMMRSRQIAADLIRKAPASDRFILLQFQEAHGIKHLAGPEGTKEEWLKSLGFMSLSATATKPGSGNSGTRIGMEAELQPTMDLTRMPKEMYKYQMHVFAQKLSQLKYALKTIDKPKIVFLISEGMTQGSFKTDGIGQRIPGSSGGRSKFYVGQLLCLLKSIVKAINEGGSLLYTINPQIENYGGDASGLRRSDMGDPDSNGEMSLRYLAQQSGGKYFSGRDVKVVLKNVRKATSAYYELAFSVPPDAKDRYKIRFKCHRKDVKVHTLSYSERNKAYSKMTSLQKKVFAIDTISGGRWSRLVGKIVKLNFKLQKKKGKYVLDTLLPKKMRDMKLDVFIIHKGKNEKETYLEFKKIKVKDNLKVTVKNKKNRQGYIVAIDPKESRCIYGKLM